MQCREHLRADCQSPHPVFGTRSQTTLFVGAPSFRDSTGAAVGRIYAYQLSTSPTGSVSASEVFSVHGTQFAGKFGYSFSLGQPFPDKPAVLAVSAPSADTVHSAFGSKLKDAGEV